MDRKGLRATVSVKALPSWFCRAPVLAWRRVRSGGNTGGRRDAGPDRSNGFGRRVDLARSLGNVSATAWWYGASERRDAKRWLFSCEVALDLWIFGSAGAARRL